MYCANAYFGMDRIFAVISVTLEHLALWIESDPANVHNKLNFKKMPVRNIGTGIFYWLSESCTKPYPCV